MTWKLIIVLVVITLIVSIILILNTDSVQKHYERFQNNPMIVYASEFRKDYVDIVVPRQFPTEVLKPLASYPYIHVKYSDEKVENSTQCVYIEDVFTISQLKPHAKLLCIIKSCNRHFFVTKPPNTYSNESLEDVVNNSKPIYVDNNIETGILQVLAQATNNIDFDKLVSTSKTNTAYCRVRYSYILNPSILDQEPTDIIDIAPNMDIHKLKMLLPFCLIDNLDMKLYFPKLVNDSFPVYSTLVNKIGLWVDENCTIPSDILNILIDIFGDLDDTNYMTMHFSLHTLTSALLATSNKHIIQRDQLPILEQFNNNDLIDVTTNTNVEGFFIADNNVFVLPDGVYTINGIPIQLINNLYLTSQDRSEENGVYSVMSINKRSFVKVQNRVKKSNDMEYICVGDTSIKNKPQCISNFDELGIPRQKKYVWDRPCQDNMECPFYQKNKNYKNYRGGCNSGYCEFPLGVQRLGYQQYVGTPMCYNCPINDLHCCATQSNPDYAFELDWSERKSL